ncbi:MAG: DNA repair protein RadC [Lachnospiraceae bacterium]|nr:DNA repair protein RadC [Lachnospiraceae bacterium]MBQ9643408.1 DNA repair protein RadC [Lachnospiraceae bacterium]
MKHPEMPYERFLAYGAKSLTNAELLAVILRTGTSQYSATELAGQILSLNGSDDQSLSILYDLSMSDLRKINGIGEVKAIKLLCLSELAGRMQQGLKERNLQFNAPQTVAEYYMETMCHLEQEQVLLLLLDSRLALIREQILSIGTANMAVLSPRDVFRNALKEGAVFVMLLHNHPSGNPAPSDEDIELTRRIASAGRMLELELLDHIIIGSRRFVSMKEAGYLK